jgi:CBS domain-containing protein
MAMYAKEIMSPVGETVPGETTLVEGASHMVRTGRGFLLVEAGGKTGIVTEWDFIKAMAKQIDPKSVKLGDIMSYPLIKVAPSTPTDEVATLMSEKGVRRLLVEENGKIVGIITSKDIIKIFRKYVDEITEAVVRFRPF